MDATALVSAWNTLVIQLSCVFTEPTAHVWRQLVMGWILHRGPATVTGMYRTLMDAADRHWTVYEKFFYRARWSLDKLCLALVRFVVLPLIKTTCPIDQETGQWIVDLHFDDTTAERNGRHVAHAGWFKDASAEGASRRGAVIHWAHNWVVAALSLRLPQWPGTRWTLPILFRLYRKRGDCDAKHPFRTRQQMVVEMIDCLSTACPEVQWRVAADGAYATRQLVRALPSGTNLVSRTRFDAALHDLPPTKRRPGQQGRNPRRGRRLPSPKEMANRRRKGWKSITVQYQGRQVKKRVLGITCLWYHVCGPKPIRLVMVSNPSDRRDDYLFCTEACVADEEIVQRYVDRWGIEEVFREAKQQLGFESTCGWCSQTVIRQAPLAMVLMTLIKVWYGSAALKVPWLRPQPTPWNPRKNRPSFLDMLSGLRRVLWIHRIPLNSRTTKTSQKIIDDITYALCQAA